MGPPFLNDMCSIIRRFLSFTNRLSTDIEKAFLHVGLDQRDRDFTRFFWLSHHEEAAQEFATKRKVLQASSRVFDPLGFLSPVIVTPHLRALATTGGMGLVTPQGAN